MALRRLAKEQPSEFAFAPATLAKAEWWMRKYPAARKQSAVIPILWIVQRQCDGWLPEPAISAVAELLDMPRIRVLEVATFYTMFKLEPVGKHLVQVCGTTPCWLRGAEAVKEACRKRIGPVGSTSDDGLFTWEEVECLGACVNAPMVQISNAQGDHYYEDLTEETMATILSELEAHGKAAPGPRVDRQRSAPAGEVITLSDATLFDGSRAKPVSLPNSASGVRAQPVAEATAPAKPASRTSEPEAPAYTMRDEDKPATLAAATDGKPDDLKRISGIGPKIETTLHGLGVFHFSQIADWTPANVQWIDAYLSFKGRVVREQWIEQAKVLASGEATEFAKRVDAGDVETSKD